METIIQKALRLLLDKYGANYDCVTVIEENGHYRASIETPESARLIGRNGTVLNALQILLKNILWHQNEEKVFVTIDVDGYRQEQYDRVYSKVGKTIDLMKERNLSEIKLEPMRPFIRRLVHLWIADNYPDLSTDSVGEGRDRAVRVHYK
ncbi:KH domain-containing protein [Candidatus Gracilibacteria bacterium]|nr:KH domain-containing protein [Candidatus Gracilibacteria bacterium]